MNVHQSRVALRPRNPLEVFDLALTLLRAHPGAFTKLWLLTAGPATVLAGVLAWPLDLGWWVLLLGPLAHPLLHAPFTLLAGRLLFDGSVKVRTVVKELLRHPFRALGAWFWTAGGLVVGVGCSLVGAFLTLPGVVFAGEAGLLEGGDAAKTLGRALRLASSNPGNAVAAMLAWMLLTVWGMLVGEGIGQALVGFVFQLGEPFGSLFQLDATPYMAMGAVAVQPLVGLFKLLLYVDARTRVEGWDLQVGLRAARLGAS